MNFPEAYREKCPYGDFAGLWSFVLSFMGMPEDATVTDEDAHLDGNFGWFEFRFHYAGEELDLGTDNAEPDFEWDGERWWAYVSEEDMAKEEPCTLFQESTPTPNADAHCDLYAIACPYSYAHSYSES